METTKEFSEGFLHDIADLMDMCYDNDTDSVELYFTVKNKKLKLDITFSVDQS